MKQLQKLAALNKGAGILGETLSKVIVDPVAHVARQSIKHPLKVGLPLGAAGAATYYGGPKVVAEYKKARSQMGGGPMFQHMGA